MILPRAFSLTESCSNNVAEYNALLIGLQLAHGMGVRYLEAYGDSKLIINQVKGEYEVRHEDLVPYYHTVIELANLFVTPQSHEYGDVTATYIRESKVPPRIYAKHQYRQESEYGSKWCIIHSNPYIQLQNYHQSDYNIT